MTCPLVTPVQRCSDSWPPQTDQQGTPPARPLTSLILTSRRACLAALPPAGMLCIWGTVTTVCGSCVSCLGGSRSWTLSSPPGGSSLKRQHSRRKQSRKPAQRAEGREDAAAYAVTHARVSSCLPFMFLCCCCNCCATVVAVPAGRCVFLPEFCCIQTAFTWSGRQHRQSRCEKDLGDTGSKGRLRGTSRYMHR